MNTIVDMFIKLLSQSDQLVFTQKLLRQWLTSLDDKNEKLFFDTLYGHDGIKIDSKILELIIDVIAQDAQQFEKFIRYTLEKEQKNGELIGRSDFSPVAIILNPYVRIENFLKFIYTQFEPIFNMIASEKVNYDQNEEIFTYRSNSAEEEFKKAFIEGFNSIIKDISKWPYLIQRFFKIVYHIKQQQGINVEEINRQVLSLMTLRVIGAVVRNLANFNLGQTVNAKSPYWLTIILPSAMQEVTSVSEKIVRVPPVLLHWTRGEGRNEVCSALSKVLSSVSFQTETKLEELTGVEIYQYHKFISKIKAREGLPKDFLGFLEVQSNNQNNTGRLRSHSRSEARPPFFCNSAKKLDNKLKRGSGSVPPLWRTLQSNSSSQTISGRIASPPKTRETDNQKNALKVETTDEQQRSNSSPR